MATQKDWTGGKASIYKTIGASNHTEEAREVNDFYATDPIAIDKLLSAGAVINKNVWECACGAGHLSEKLIKNGFNVKSTDLVDRGYGQSGVDFLKQKDVFDGDILTNPPYKFASEFVEKALTLVPEKHKVFMFLKLTFLEGKKRKQMFKKTPPKVIYVFSERCMCAKNGDFKAAVANGGSAVCYAWFEFENGFKGEPVVKWI